MAKNALDLAHIFVEFSGNKVLSDVHASIPEGGLTVFVGPNGAGKTTLLLCIMGEVPYRGEIRFHPDIRGYIGYVPQNLQTQTYTPITCAEFLGMSFSRRPLWLGMSKAGRAAVARVLARVGMEHAEKRCISELSGGEMRRILLAAALLRSPRLLLLDEPAAGVDMRGERLFWDILDDLRTREKITIVMVSHNLSLTAHYASHVICVSRGRCMEGTPHAILTAQNLMTIFGIPIHLYPDQCALSHDLCPMCGAFSMGSDVPSETAVCDCKPPSVRN